MRRRALRAVRLEFRGHQAFRPRPETYQDELRRLLHKYGIEYDERYVWD